MLDAQDHLDRSDAERLAAFHRAALRGSILGRMGADMLPRYYRWAAGSPREHVFVERAGARPVGAAVLSFEPGTVLRRFAGRAPFAFGGALAASFLRDSGFRADLMAYAGERLRADREPTPAPELLQIFVDASERNRSVGSRLLARVEAVLEARDADRYYVRTLVEDNTATRAFYARRGFSTVRQLDVCGAQYVLLSKPAPGVRR
jgi:GNAT superfamily N-acetyltransferase